MSDFELVEVECYSGRRYGERPRSFHLRGEKYYVEEVVKEWLEPGERHFEVTVRGDGRFELVYNERNDAWQAKGPGV